MDTEDALESALERLENSKYPTSVIADRSFYTGNILSAKNMVIDAEENLTELKERITFLKETLESFE